MESSDWLRKKWNELIKEFGGKCLKCGREQDLHFAHIFPTGLNGMGRGKWRRYYDIKRNNNCYVQLCKECHSAMDAGFYEYKNGQIIEVKLYESRILFPVVSEGGGDDDF